MISCDCQREFLAGNVAKTKIHFVAGTRKHQGDIQKFKWSIHTVMIDPLRRRNLEKQSCLVHVRTSLRQFVSAIGYRVGKNNPGWCAV